MKKRFALPSLAMLLVVAGAFSYSTLSSADEKTVIKAPTVAVAAADTTPPQITITAPDAPVVSGPWVMLSATSTDDVGVVGVEFKYQKPGSGTGPISLGVDTTSERNLFPSDPIGITYSRIWDTTAVEDGTYILYAIARDAAGNTTTARTRVRVVGKAPYDKQETFRPGAYGDTKILASTQFTRPRNGIQTFLWASVANASSVTNYLPYITKEFDYLWLAQGALTTPRRSYDYAGKYSFDRLFSAIKSIKISNPNLKIGIYAGHGGTLAPWNNPFASMTPSDFLHDPSNSTILFRYHRLHKEQFLNIASPATRKRLVEFWKGTFAAHPELDSLFLDGYVSYATDKGFQGYGNKGQYDPNLATGCKEGPCTTLQYWVDALSAYSTELRRDVTSPRGGDLIYNGINSAPNKPAATQYGDALNRGWVQWNDGALLEWAHEIYLSPDLFEKYIEDMDWSLAQGKKIFFYIQSRHLGSTRLYPGLIWNNDLQLEQFFLASFLLIQKNPLTYFFYNPGAFYQINQGVYYYPNWNYDYGVPTGGYTKAASGLYSRSFTNGIAVVNPTSEPLAFTLPSGKQYRVWDPSGATLASGSISIPAKTGVYYFK